MSYCNKCGKKLSDDSMFCNKCEAKVNEAASKPICSKPLSSTKKILIIISIFIVVYGGGILLPYMNKYLAISRFTYWVYFHFIAFIFYVVFTYINIRRYCYKKKEGDATVREFLVFLLNILILIAVVFFLIANYSDFYNFIGHWSYYLSK